MREAEQARAARRPRARCRRAAGACPATSARRRRSTSAQLAALVESLRGVVPTELSRQLAEALRELLIALRAVLDWYIARLEPRRAADAPTCRTSRSNERLAAVSALVRLRELPPELRNAGIAAAALVLSLFLPWYSSRTCRRARREFVQAQRDRVRRLQLRRGRGAAGRGRRCCSSSGRAASARASTCRAATAPRSRWPAAGRCCCSSGGCSTSPTRRTRASDYGIQWGIFVALAAAGALLAMGLRVRAVHRPEPPNPARRRARAGRRAPRPPRRRAESGGGHRGARRAARLVRRAARAAATARAAVASHARPRSGGRPHARSRPTDRRTPGCSRRPRARPAPAVA